MANMLMMRYAASRSNDGDNGGLQNNYNRPGMGYNNGDEMRHTNQPPTHGEYDGGAENRYRGVDGRWKAGTRRSEYSDIMREYDERRSGGDDVEEEEGRKYKIEVLPQSNVVEWPYSTPQRHESRSTTRQIGFGAFNRMEDESRMIEHDDMEMGHSGMEPMEFNRETAEHWVRSMRNEDKAHPVGGKWSPEMLKPLAQKYGIPTEGKKFWELYAMTNAMYSDYGEVAKKFGITSPEFYVCMAKAWMEDKDSEPDKTALYYEYIVKK